MINEFSGKFLATEVDGFRIQSGDAREVRNGGCLRLIGKGGDIPATLGFTHAREQQIDLMMVTGKLGIGACVADTTLAAMDNRSGL